MGESNDAPLRIVQWTTGGVARQAVRGVLADPDLELVGAFAHSADKVGRDVGELCGLAPIGVAATDDVDALIALAADCVVYTPLHFDVAEVSNLLEHGINIVTSAEFLTGRGLGAAEFAHATIDLDLPGRPIEAGTVAGIDLRWEGIVDGRAVVELHQRWTMGSKLDPPMPVESGYPVEVDGEPKIRTRVEIWPHQEDLSALTAADFHAIGMVITGLPVVNAISSVCAAVPGIRTDAELPVVAGTGRIEAG